jgi:hypothetical protein
MTDGENPDFLEIVHGQSRKDVRVDRILSKRGYILRHSQLL